MAKKEKMGSVEFSKLLSNIPAGTFFLSFLEDIIENFDSTEITLKKADFMIEEKKLNIEFDINTGKDKMTFKIGSDGDSKYFLRYESNDKAYIISYETEDIK